MVVMMDGASGKGTAEMRAVTRHRRIAEAIESHGATASFEFARLSRKSGASRRVAVRRCALISRCFPTDRCRAFYLALDGRVGCGAAGELLSQLYKTGIERASRGVETPANGTSTPRHVARGGHRETRESARPSQAGPQAIQRPEHHARRTVTTAPRPGRKRLDYRSNASWGRSDMMGIASSWLRRCTSQKRHYEK
jgi:hypothetical protein